MFVSVTTSQDELPSSKAPLMETATKSDAFDSAKGRADKCNSQFVPFEVEDISSGDEQNVDLRVPVELCVSPVSPFDGDKASEDAKSEPCSTVPWKKRRITTIKKPRAMERIDANKRYRFNSGEETDEKVEEAVAGETRK